MTPLISQFPAPAWQLPPSAITLSDRCVDIWRIPLSGDRPRQQSHRAREKILRRYLSLPDCEALVFAAGAGGKPFVSQPPGVSIECNLSHSHGMALLAVSQRWPVGVDIERLRPIRDPLRIAQRVLPAESLAELAARPKETRQEAFFVHWTRFESQQKAVGRGLFAPPVEKGYWTVRSFCPAHGYVACVTIDVHRPVDFRHFDLIDP